MQKGSNTAQYLSNASKLKFGGDTADDETSILIGMELYKAYPRSRDITANIILNKIISKPNSSFPESKAKH